jgi:hypothetical protein
VANNLNFGGAEVILVRNKGVANAVQNFITYEITQGANITALPTTVLFTLDERIQIPLFTGNVYFESITLSSDNIITVSAQAVLQNNITFSSNNTLNTLSNLEMYVSTLLDSDSSVNELGGLETLGDLSLLTDNQILLNANQIIEAVRILTADGTISVGASKEYNDSILLQSNASIDLLEFLTKSLRLINPSMLKNIDKLKG